MVMMAVGILRGIMVVIVMVLMSGRRMIQRAVFSMITMAMLIKRDECRACAIAVIIGNAARQLHHHHRHKGEYGDGKFR